MKPESSLDQLSPKQFDDLRHFFQRYWVSIFIGGNLVIGGPYLPEGTKNAAYNLLNDVAQYWEFDPKVLGINMHTEPIFHGTLAQHSGKSDAQISEESGVTQLHDFGN